MTIMQPLRDEHQQLVPHIEHLRAVADDVGEVPPDTLARHVGEAHRFLTEELIPHAEAEDAWLYPAVDRLLGDARATETMRRDHVEVGRLTAELGALGDRLLEHGLDSALARELRRVLYGLYALVSVHFAKEEEVYVPLLEEGLSAEEAHELFTAMHHAGHAAH
jgi:iron-sulfur cluster repair protein YtfE (RIC family)